MSAVMKKRMRRFLRKTTHPPTLMDLGMDCLTAIDTKGEVPQIDTNSLLMPCMHICPYWTHNSSVNFLFYIAFHIKVCICTDIMIDKKNQYNLILKLTVVFKH